VLRALIEVEATVDSILSDVFSSGIKSLDLLLSDTFSSGIKSLSANQPKDFEKKGFKVISCDYNSFVITNIISKIVFINIFRCFI